MIDHATELLRVSEQTLTDLITSLKVTFTGPTKLASAADPRITDPAKLNSKLEQHLYLRVMVNQQRPLAFWRPLISQAIEDKLAADKDSLYSKIAYKHASNTSLKDFVNLIVENPQPEDYAALTQFIWQVKRKMLGREVIWHLMPILWGKSGSGKSSAIKSLLAPVWGFVLECKDPSKFNDEKFSKQLHQHYVGFLDEIIKIADKDAASLKRLITETDLTARVFYSQDSARFKQNCTFIACSNEGPSDLIYDAESMRRYFYMKSPDAMDWAALAKINIEEIWQSVNEEMDTPAWFLDNKAAIDKRQEAARNTTALEDFIGEGYLDPQADGVFESTEAFDEYHNNYVKANGSQAYLTKQRFNKRLVEQFGFVRIVEGMVEYNNRARFYPTFKGKFIKNPKNVVTIIGNKNLKGGSK